MPLEIRAIGPDEVDAILVADGRGFGQAGPVPEGHSRAWAEGELDRTRVAFDGGEVVGVSRTYSFELTMPGGALVPVAAVSWVSVIPTHRRRGVLTAMIEAMHDDARERGEPAAILTASESVIYGRYGYGTAAWRLALLADRAHIEFVTPDDDTGSMRFVTRAEGLTALPPIYERTRRARAGMVTRPDFWWEPVFWDYMSDGGKKAFFVAVHRDANGDDDGFVAYEITGDWSGGLSERRLMVWDMQAATPDVRIALWRFVFGVDLIGTVAATNVPIDDPLRHVVTDPRRVRVDFVNDGLWIAPLDAAALLGARNYAVPGAVVIEVHAPDGNATTLAVECDTSGATSCVAATNATPDIVCTSAALGMGVLGGTRWSELADARRIEVRAPGNLALADAMFGCAPAPALLSYF